MAKAMQDMFYTKAAAGSAAGPEPLAVRKDGTSLDFSDMGPKPSKFCGIQNQGATCYLNSLVQALYMTPGVRRALFAFRPEHDVLAVESSLAQQLQRMFAYMQLSHKRAVRSQGLTRSFGWEGSEVFQQHDVQELYHVILEAFQNKYSALPLAKQISALYQGLAEGYVQCRACGTRNVRADTFVDLSLNIKGLPGLQSALKDWLQPEVLSGNNKYRCVSEQCKGSKQDADKGVLLRRLPPMLVLQLKRFDMNWSRGVRIKLSDDYKFPRLLDMTPFISSSEDTKDAALSAEQRAPLMYQLTAILMHQGGATAGHYYAYLLDQDSDLWFQFNDSSVTPVEKKVSDLWFAVGEMEAAACDGSKEVNELQQRSAWQMSVHTDAYLLMYQQLQPNPSTEQNAHILDADPALLPETLQKEIAADNADFALRKKEWERRKDLLEVQVHLLGASQPPVVLHDLLRSRTSLAMLTERVWQEYVVQGRLHGTPRSDVRLVKRQEDTRPGVMLPGAAWPSELQEVPIAQLDQEEEHWRLPILCTVNLILQKKEADSGFLEVQPGDKILTLQARIFSPQKARKCFPTIPSSEQSAAEAELFREERDDTAEEELDLEDLCKDENHGPKLFFVSAKGAKVSDVRAAAAELLGEPVQRVRMLLCAPLQSSALKDKAATCLKAARELGSSLDAELVESRKVGLQNGDILVLEICEDFRTAPSTEDYSLLPILQFLSCQSTVSFNRLQLETADDKDEKAPRVSAEKAQTEQVQEKLSSEENLLHMRVDMRWKLATLRTLLARRLSLPPGGFCIRVKGRKECKDESKDLAHYGIGADPNVCLRLCLGKPLLPSEYRLKLFLHDPEQKSFSKLGTVVVQKTSSLAQLKAQVEKLGGPPATHQRIWTKVKERLVKLCTDDQDVQTNLSPLRDGKELAVLRTSVEEKLTVDHIFLKVRQWYPARFELGPQQDLALLRSSTVQEARNALLKLYRPASPPVHLLSSSPSAASSGPDPMLEQEHVRFAVARPFHFSDLPQICMRPWHESSPEQEASLKLSDPPFSLKAGMYIVFKDNRVPERFTPSPLPGADVPAPASGGIERALKIF